MPSGTPSLPPFGGLCPGCLHALSVPTSKGSVFLQCGRAAEDPAYRRYPQQPVLRCAGWTPRADPAR